MRYVHAILIYNTHTHTHIYIYTTHTSSTLCILYTYRCCILLHTAHHGASRFVSENRSGMDRWTVDDFRWQLLSGLCHLGCVGLSLSRANLARRRKKTMDEMMKWFWHVWNSFLSCFLFTFSWIQLGVVSVYNIWLTQQFAAPKEGPTNTWLKLTMDPLTRFVRSCVQDRWRIQT